MTLTVLAGDVTTTSTLPTLVRTGCCIWPPATTPVALTKVSIIAFVSAAFLDASQADSFAALVFSSISFSREATYPASAGFVILLSSFKGPEYIGDDTLVWCCWNKPWCIRSRCCWAPTDEMPIILRCAVVKSSGETPARINSSSSMPSTTSACILFRSLCSAASCWTSTFQLARG